MYAREITEVMEDRGFSPKQIKQFFNVYPDKGNDYSVEMVDTFEYSVNGPVIENNHPSTFRKI